MRTGLIPLITIIACGSPRTTDTPDPHSSTELRDDLRRAYDSVHVEGSFVMHDPGRDHWVLVDTFEGAAATLPASSYKILGSLIALEEGVVADEHQTLPWDSIHRRPDIDHDLNLRDALVHSAYWFHRDVARHIGRDRLKYWWDAVDYGNADTSGGYDRAWVAGALRITPRQQVRFLERLQSGDLPFSKRSMDIVKRIMVQEDTLGHVLRGKTGWAQTDTGDVGWFVGWVERSDSTGPYFFANRLRCDDSTNAAFESARRGIALDFLQQLGVLP